MWTNIYSPQVGNWHQIEVWVPTKVQLGEPMSFTGISYRSMGEESLREPEKTTASPKSTPACGTTHKIWKPGAHCTAIGSSTAGTWIIYFYLMSVDCMDHRNPPGIQCQHMPHSSAWPSVAEQVIDISIALCSTGQGHQHDLHGNMGHRHQNGPQ